MHKMNLFIQNIPPQYMKINMTCIQDAWFAFNICVLHTSLLVLQTYVPKKDIHKMPTHRAREDYFNY